ncbi:hypothetical protein [Bacteroides sp.]|uniref:hypothetical protein n=1 Tax=Bacteroides sp. TaxID=29523 RepID=UPI0023D2902E|nr:hypothetical protein [Bacteroides sp.]MDE6216720.1 hypothetical protein [Bacteroides sp.]
MKRIFPNVIEIYNVEFYSTDDPEADKNWEEYEESLPTFQEFFRKISNKRALDAGVKIGIISASKKSSNKKKIVILRRIMNLFRIIPIRKPNSKDPAPTWTHLWYGLSGTNKKGFPTGIWFEYFWNPLEVVAGSKFGLEDDDCYEVAIATAEYYRLYRFEEFIDLSNKYMYGK